MRTKIDFRMETSEPANLEKEFVERFKKLQETVLNYIFRFGKARIDMQDVTPWDSAGCFSELHESEFYRDVNLDNCEEILFEKFKNFVKNHVGTVIEVYVIGTKDENRTV